MTVDSAVSTPAKRSAGLVDHATVGYRTVFRVRGADAVDVAERNVRNWLAQKLRSVSVLDDWDGQSSTRFSDQLRIIVVGQGEPGRSRRRLYRLIDTNPGGIFEISLYSAAATADEGHLVIEGARVGVTREEAIDGVATPNIVRQILEDIEVLDGATALTGRPSVVRSGEAHDVLDAILDERRTMPVIVASSLHPQVDSEWLDLIDQLTRFSVGVATVFVVYADAVDELNRSLPGAFQVPPARVRTFAPGVDLENPSDGLLHRFLGPATLERSMRGGRIRGVLPAVHARGSRLRLLERSVPTDARRTMDLLSRAELEQRRSDAVHRRVNAVAAAPAVPVAPADDLDQSVAALTDLVSPAEAVPPIEPPIADSVETPEEPLVRGLSAFVVAIARLVRKWLRQDKVTAESIDQLDRFVEGQVEGVAVAGEQIDEVVTENEGLQRELEKLRRALDEREVESAVGADELRELSHQNRLLKRQLRKANIFAVVDDSPIDWRPPTDVSDLVTRLTPGVGEHVAFARVVFTGDVDDVIEVEKRDPYGKYARDLWDFIRVLFEYAELRVVNSFAGNVHMYLSDDNADGYKCNPQRHAGRESESVLNNDQWRAERVRPVPTEVEPSGFVLMDAHFKPTHRDMFAPRMHYYDDTNKTGKVYIGYIGKHLSTTQAS